MHIKNMIFLFFSIPFWTTVLAISVGFFNYLHPLFDSLSNFRIHLIILLIPQLFLMLFLHNKKAFQLSYSFLLLFVGAYLYYIFQPFQAKTIIEKKHSLKQMQFNLSFRNKKIETFIDYIDKNPMDIITLQEVTPEHRQRLEELKNEGYDLDFKSTYPFVERKKGAYPYQYYCEFRGVGGGAILSKHPINKGNAVCIEGEGLLWAEVQLPSQSIYVASIHLHWPFPYHQQEQIHSLKPVLKYMPSPKLISGDFNAVAWSDAVHQIEEASKTKAVEGLRWSIQLKKQLPLLPFMQLSIDHLLLSVDFDVKNIEVKEDLGSDHLPIVSEIYYK